MMLVKSPHQYLYIFWSFLTFRTYNHPLFVRASPQHLFVYLHFLFFPSQLKHLLLVLLADGTLKSHLSDSTDRIRLSCTRIRFILTCARGSDPYRPGPKYVTVIQLTTEMSRD